MESKTAPEARIYVEFGTAGGILQPISISSSPADWAAKSRQAFDSAMDVVGTVASKFISQLTSLPKKPTSVELEFGLIFDMEVGAIFAKMSQEGSLSIKLCWDMGETSAKPTG